MKPSLNNFINSIPNIDNNTKLTTGSLYLSKTNSKLILAGLTDCSKVTGENNVLINGSIESH
jgi:hypothetical protein